ncbi:MAG: LPS export ABC transporter permease LptF [Burkholderiaceae bacterium]
MIAFKSFLQEVRGIAGAVFAVLLTILVTSSLIRMLGAAASDRADSELVVPLVAFAALQALPVVLALTVYLSVLLALTRAWKDSEMVVWMSSGLGLGQWLRPVARFVWPFALATVALTFIVSPWAQQQLDETRREFSQRPEDQRLDAGRFMESRSGQIVFFGEMASDTEKSLGLVFIRAESAGQEAVILASKGEIQPQEGGGAWLSLAQGTRTDFNPVDLETRQLRFDAYRLFLDRSPVPEKAPPSLRASGLVELVGLSRQGDLAAMAELSYRIGLCLMALAMPFFAIPVAVTSPRLGRSLHLIFGVVSFMLAMNSVTLVQALIAEGRMAMSLGWWLTPAVIAVVTAGLFWWRQQLRPNPLGRLLRALFPGRSVARKSLG